MAQTHAPDSSPSPEPWQFPNRFGSHTPTRPLVTQSPWILTRLAKPKPSETTVAAVGHCAKECELQFDVWHMTADELSELMENQLAALDVARSEPEEGVVTTLTEDFVSSSE
ncbi:hypothetical protein M413DRAFT_24290 [Hebeloma cylindrosporum]|uniref:Uncharacterized protein n=1 Tax=Hebeloma cylindrosporum TaxID=76867 RepID=A0A0C3CMM2_HEBCY|nr:hypothetical protein M413DRAFT_24290 [Hebeloma cylindrosporum h7]